MNAKRKKALREHWEASKPENRAGILEVFANSGSAEELAFLQALNKGESPEDAPAAPSTKDSSAPVGGTNKKEKAK